MKTKILSYCLLAGSVLAATSCSDFLTEKPQGTLTPENYFSNQAELDMSVYALYSKVQAFQCNSNPMIVQCQGDDVTSTTGSNKAAYLSADAFEVPTDPKGLEDNWARYYTIIKAANLIIDNARKAKTSEAEINIALGQAYYWRAFSYFGLVRVFGELPMNLTNEPDNNTTPLSSVEDVYNQILADLDAAEKCNLPVKYSGANRSINGVNIYVSEQAVKATQAAVYMAMAGFPLNKTEYYAKAAVAAKQVIDGVNSGKYPHQLLNDFADVYSYGKNFHSETLLGIDYNSTPGGWSEGDSQLSSCHQSGKLWSGWGDFLAERRYWASYPEGPRKDATYSKRILLSNKVAVDWWATTDGEAYDGKNNAVPDFRPMFVAFSVNQDDKGQPIAAAFDYTKPVWGGMCINKRHHLIRYSEVLCWYAESAARAGGDLAAAKDALKKVRKRAYQDAVKVSEVDGMNAQQLADAAYNEHGYEVAGYVLSMVTRRADQFRLDKLKETYDYRKGGQRDVLVKAGTETHSVDKDGKPFTYRLKADVVVPENMTVTAAWNGNASIYHNYPPKEVEKNGNLVRK
ncbi:MAG: RagB/SusD family nutrient uptake outer membrane protein [Prevotellaceae bacterium]|nr:RagB/SusD family nutrient uptake outer membrane protein [Prevotellaceae bacterium]MDY3365291.1 RagB/SusD family nutrient uptake outer membrane protein [Prevotella sp.]